MEVLNKEKVLEHAKRLIDEGKVDKAIIEYKRLLEIDPKDMRIKLRIAELLSRQKKVTEAVKVYQEVADSYTSDGFYLKAVTVYKNVLRLNPSLIDINYRLAELYEKMGLNKDAILQYQILSNSLEQKGDSEALIGVRQKMVELDPHNVANRIRLAETFQYQGREEESLNEYEGLVAEIRESGTVDRLIELYEKILSYRPDNVDMVRAISNIYYKRGEWKRVMVHLEKAEKIIGEEVDLLGMMADVYSRLNQMETARTKYKEVAELYISRGEIDEALNAYKEILVISPEEEDEVFELVSEIDEDYFEKVKKEAEEKRKRIEEHAAMVAAEESTGENEGGDVSDNLRMPSFSAEDAKLKLKDAEGAFELGKAYHQMGLPAEAQPELSKSLGLYQEILRSGHKEGMIEERIAQLVEWLGLDTLPSRPVDSHGGQGEEEPMVIDDEETIDLEVRKQMLKGEEEKFPKKQKGKEKPKKEASKKDTKKKEAKQEDKKDIKKNGKKKRDKRMGFV